MRDDKGFFPKGKKCMITRAKKASKDQLTKVATIVQENETFWRQTFPECSTTEQLQAVLKSSSQEWNVLITDEPVALFTLHRSSKSATLDNLLVASTPDYAAVARALRDEFKADRVESLTLQVPEFLVDALTSNEFEKSRSLIRLSGPVAETKVMPVLALTNPTVRDLSLLSKLMYDSYEKGLEPKLPTIGEADATLRQIFAGTYGDYVAEASFMSSSSLNTVSACFVTLTSKEEARIAALFTHPLYRARGFATIEVAMSMNRLTKLTVKRLAVFVGERNDVSLRMFAKLGFKQDQKLVEMILRTK
jgi:hypothetical protein